MSIKFLSSNRNTYSPEPRQAKFSSMITKCYASNNGTVPNIFTNNSELEEIEQFKCEHPDISKPDESLPVSDPSTKLTYRNVYCAKCNNVNENTIYTWETHIECVGKPDRLIESQPNKVELFERLTSREWVERTGCDLMYITGQEYYHRECRSPTDSVIKRCNVTGRWDRFHYNAEIEKACLMYTSLFYNRYKNVFCFLCNEFYPQTLEDLMELIHEVNSNPGRLSFDALFSFSDHDNTRKLSTTARPKVDCNSTQFYDNATCTCREMKCSEGKYFDEDTRSCEVIFQTSFIGFEGCAEVKIELARPPEFSLIDDIPHLVIGIMTTYKWIVTVSEWCPCDRTITIHVNIWEIQLVDFENMRRVDNFGTWEELEWEFEENAMNLCDILKYDSRYNELQSCKFNFIEECPLFDRFSRPCADVRVRPVEQSVVRGPPLVDDLDNKIMFLKYRKTNLCTFVEIELTEFNVVDDTLISNVSGKSISILNVDFIKNNTFIRICLKDFVEWTALGTSHCYVNMDEPRDDSFLDDWTAEGLISIISSSISLIFLFLTFITYLLFDEIRSGGGKNIMVLTAILFTAIALYEFAIEQVENEALCKIFGVLIHYFWLASVFSMNGCTIERFVKLCFPLESRSFFMSRKSFLLETAYAVVCPLIIVGLNVVINVAVRTEIGYGSYYMCYINAWYSRVFAFVVPMCLVVCVNIVLFILMVVKLKRHSGPAGCVSSHTRVGLVACIRLSFVTGATWLVSLLYEAIRVKAMSYIFTAFLGLQGVVFFFSIVFNKRVLEFYKRSLKLNTRQRSGSSSDRTVPSSKEDEHKAGARQVNKTQEKYATSMEANTCSTQLTNEVKSASEESKEQKVIDTNVNA